MTVHLQPQLIGFQTIASIEKKIHRLMDKPLFREIQYLFHALIGLPEAPITMDGLKDRFKKGDYCIEENYLTGTLKLTTTIGKKTFIAYYPIDAHRLIGDTNKYLAFRLNHFRMDEGNKSWTYSWQGQERFFYDLARA